MTVSMFPGVSRWFYFPDFSFFPWLLRSFGASWWCKPRVKSSSSISWRRALQSRSSPRKCFKLAQFVPLSSFHLVWREEDQVSQKFPFSPHLYAVWRSLGFSYIMQCCTMQGFFFTRKCALSMGESIDMSLSFSVTLRKPQSYRTYIYSI